VRRAVVTIRALGRGNQSRALTRTVPLATGWQPARHRVGRHVATAVQERIQSGHRRQPAAHRAQRHPTGLMVTDRMQWAVHRRAARALRGHERQHIRRLHRLRPFADHGQEHLQVVGSGQHRVRPATAGHEPQILLQQRHAKHRCPGRSSERTDQAQVQQRRQVGRCQNPRAMSAAARRRIKQSTRTIVRSTASSRRPLAQTAARSMCSTLGPIATSTSSLAKRSGASTTRANGCLVER
jgi:hypothetical protein